MRPSVLWLNGPFGVGKTTAATGLVAADSRWRCADPELLGTFLSRAEGSCGTDFQQHPAWPALVVAGLQALEPTPERPVVVPMTVLDRDRWHVLVDGLPLRTLHVVLHADAAVLMRRIDAGERRSRSWRFDRLSDYEGAQDWLTQDGTWLRTDLLDADGVVAALRAGWDRVCTGGA